MHVCSVCFCVVCVILNPNVTRQTECFLNSLDLFRASIWGGEKNSTGNVWKKKIGKWLDKPSLHHIPSGPISRGWRLSISARGDIMHTSLPKRAMACHALWLNSRQIMSQEKQKHFFLLKKTTQCRSLPIFLPAARLVLLLLLGLLSSAVASFCCHN